MVEGHGGGILALVEALVDHWGAVGRDLIAAHLHYEGFGLSVGDPLEFSELVQFVHYSPPGTALHFSRNEGFTFDTHYLAQIYDNTLMSLYLKTEDAQLPPEAREYQPKPTPRPGVVYVDTEPERHGVTVEEYAKVAGLQLTWKG